jgi:hypothetical protein
VIRPCAWLVAAAFAWPVGAQAVMYRCPPAEDGGAPVVTNLLSEDDARVRACERVGVRTSPLDVVVSPRPAASRAPARIDPVVHRVDPAEQRGRDDQRRTILETELRAEEDALARARAGAGADMAKVVARHADNVDALRRELGRMK